MVLLYSIIFILGTFIGSFLNCIIHRLHTGESFMLCPPTLSSEAPKGRRGKLPQERRRVARSHCPHCKKELKCLDLIPILSFITLKAKCRYCQKKISLQYPLMEIATGSLFLLIFNFQFSWTPAGGLPGGLLFNFQNLINFIYLLIISCFLIIIFVYDLKHYIIPDKVLFPAIGVALVFNIFNSYFILHNSIFLLNSILSGLLACGFFLTIFLISRGKWMGFGDVKFAFFMGLLLGFPNIILALFSGFLIGAIIGVGLILCGKKTMKSQVPFGPFLIAGTFIALLWGEGIVSWYLSLIA